MASGSGGDYGERLTHQRDERMLTASAFAAHCAANIWDASGALPARYWWWSPGSGPNGGVQVMAEVTGSEFRVCQQ